jgi:hypothetical protein
MTSDTPSRLSLAFTWLVVALCAALLVIGIVWHGLSLEVQQRFWTNIFERFGGPMGFRVYLQPAMAFIAALHDGLKDARGEHKSFFWTAWFDRSQPAGRLREGLISVARVLFLGMSIDFIYQFKELDAFYPAEAAVIAILLAVIPYFIFRWLVEIVTRWWLGRHPKSQSEG